ncbi:YbjQ family protein [Clostridium sp. DSM 17811]|nr:YbjQ family protein [Clostridium sp. DSM 17811]
MIVVTTENITGYKALEVKGQVFGLIVRSRGLGGNIMAGLRSLVGGEIHEYTSMLEDARKQALDRLVKNATVMGANAVVMMRFDSSEIGQNMMMVLRCFINVILQTWNNMKPIMVLCHQRVHRLLTTISYLVFRGLPLIVYP